MSWKNLNNTNKDYLEGIHRSRLEHLPQEQCLKINPINNKNRLYYDYSSLTVSYQFLSITYQSWIIRLGRYLKSSWKEGGVNVWYLTLRILLSFTSNWVLSWEQPENYHLFKQFKNEINTKMSQHIYQFALVFRLHWEPSYLTILKQYHHQWLNKGK